jgi:hypothetical protein
MARFRAALVAAEAEMKTRGRSGGHEEHDHQRADPRTPGDEGEARDPDRVRVPGDRSEHAEARGGDNDQQGAEEVG